MRGIGRFEKKSNKKVSGELQKKGINKMKTYIVEVRSKSLLDFRVLYKELNSQHNSNMKPTITQGYYKDGNKYYQLIVQNIEQKEVSESGNYLHHVSIDVETFDEDIFSKLDNKANKLVKAFEIDNEFWPRYNALLFDSEVDNYKSLLNYHVEELFGEKEAMEIVSHTALPGDETGYTFDVILEDTEEAQLILSVDTDRRVGYTFGNNNGVISRVYLYKSDLKVA